MKKENTIKRSFRNKIFIYSLLPVIIILAIISVVISMLRWKQYYNEVDTGSINNAQYINMQFTNLEHTMNNIISDGVFDEVFRIDSSTDFSERIVLLNELNKYCNRFYNSYNADKVRIKIYHDNYNVYRSEYLGYINELSDEVLSEVTQTENSVGKWIAGDRDTTLFCNMSNKKYTVILSCSIDSFSLKSFLNTNIYYSNMGLSSQDVSIQNTKPDRQNGFMIVQPLISGQYLVINIPKTKMAELFLPIIGICTAIALFVFVVSLILSNNTSVKLTQKLYDFFSFIKNEKLYEDIDKVQIDKNDEFYEVFEKVKQLVHDMENVSAEKNKLLTENINLQLAHAQSQINPHLLYNSLSVIRWSCIDNNPELVDKVDAMVDYYRLSINDINDDYTIGNEIELIKKYIRLISFLHEVDYKYKINIDEKLMGLVTIQHIFQPFIENSVLHGINGNPDGEIDITGEIDGGNIVFGIADNGIGFDKSEVKAKLADGMGKHIGLENTIHRIKLHYGKESTVNVVSAVGRGTEVIITIPINDTIIFKQIP